MKSVCANIREVLRRNRLRIIVAGVIATLLLLFLWPSIVISIKPGELGVLYARFRGGTQLQHTYEEGIHFIQPWNIMYIYDVRVQEETQNIDVLTVDGLTINVQISLRFQIIRDRLPNLHQEIGPNYRDKVVIPIMNSAVRQTIGSYRPDDLYSTARQELQDQMLVDAVEEMGRIPILIQGFVVKSITLPEVLREAIERKLIAEQDYLRYKYILLEAQQEARRKTIEGEGIKAYQTLVNENMTQNFLRYEGIQATKELAGSSNAKVVVIGGKDGLPVILNADSPTGAGAPDTANAGKAANQGAGPKASVQGAQQSPAKPDMSGTDSVSPDQKRPEDMRPGQIQPGQMRPEPGKTPPFRPNSHSGLRPQIQHESQSGAQYAPKYGSRNDSARQNPATSAEAQAPAGAGWIAPGENVSDYIQRLNKTLLQPHRGGAVRQ
ncbi:MAG TPA: SPFH domain-containing protein [Desulfovibrio sp.]|uniref:prohibitin family protein n=1 Tax=Desulfovibrio sp. TaxID=885 RepID=UPI002D393062|nr:SPFH domain-containing protein [Desulfovibrio sp.]HZF62330.1 SPFH domain-containing protein [Desulfovibrio sp.]